MVYSYDQAALAAFYQGSHRAFLMANGLGGYCSMTAAWGAPRCDYGVLVAADPAPNVRITMVHRIQETLTVGGQAHFLSTQSFADESPEEDGFRYATGYTYGPWPRWDYAVGGVLVERHVAVAYGRNTTAVTYRVQNNTDVPATLKLVPFLKFAPKEDALEEPKNIAFVGGTIRCDDHTLYMNTDAEAQPMENLWQRLAYPVDAKDGRPAEGLAGACCYVERTVAPGALAQFEVVFSTVPEEASAESIFRAWDQRVQYLAQSCGLQHPVAQQLAVAADAYIARRDSTDGMTILAGYPLFGDWGRDTMIALTGTTLTTGRYEDAKSIIRTFLAYEKDGLVPNLFPEGSQDPMYNTVDAALLLVDCVWQYVQRSGDQEFIFEAYPVLERIVDAYQRGTHHGIGMDTDGLIFAGEGLDQVTWMDVRINDILPTPRHGKPVEVNAYWYNVLRIMEAFAPIVGKPCDFYGLLAQQVKDSFVAEFYMEDKGYLKDVISGTDADEQIRCNQIWAVSMPFGMLSPDQERSVVETVEQHLWTSHGLRTLSPEDPQYHGYYGGKQLDRDMAYHQGTTWVFPMGAYYLSYLKVNGYSEEAKAEVYRRLEALEEMLDEGCQGQLPEIYDGDEPSEGKGCFGQAWSVGEMLRVFEALEREENHG